MFLRFTLKNYRSFREEVELSFIATSRKEEPSWMVKNKHVKHGLLPVVGLWGANASGKSNLLRALCEMRAFVKHSHAHWDPTQSVPWSPWRLQRGKDDPPTEMELEFVLDDVGYAYGFSIGAQGFVEEWLFRWVSSRRQVLFSRDTKEPEGEHFYYGPSLKGDRVAISRRVRENSLFLSAAAQENHSLLSLVYRTIVDGIHPARMVGLLGHPLFDPEDPILSEDFRPVLLDLLKGCDLGISNIRVEEIEAQMDFDAAGDVFSPEFLAMLRKDMSKIKRVQVLFVHQSDSGEWELPPEYESRGTQMLLARISEIVRVLKSGGLWVVDELETALHPDLCVKLVALFCSESTNPKGAQLLFATHERELLGPLRSDEVVLLDKTRSGESSLLVASDYRGLRGRDDLRKAHKEGRIGGVPVLGDWGVGLEQYSQTYRVSGVDDSLITPLGPPRGRLQGGHRRGR